MTTLNDAQHWAVHSEASLLLIWAGPGSGKTRTLVERIKRLIGQGTSPSEIVAISYTVAAAKELSERVGQPLGFSGTLHSFLLRLLQQHGHLIGYQTGRLGVVDSEQSEELLDQACRECGWKGSLKAVRDQRGQLPSIVANRYRTLLLSNGLLSFDLILTEGLRLARELKELPYRHLIVDEVQDAAEIDLDIYQALPVENKAFCGDSDQSIFSFRGGGADLGRLIPKIDLDFDELHLEQNYRSDRAICRAAQRLIEHNSRRVQKSIEPVSTEEGQVRLIHYPNPLAEKAGIAHLISTQTGSVAVLLRFNQQVEAWAAYLEGMGLPVQRKVWALPRDWRFCRDTVALLADPENDLLAYWHVRHREGREKADSLLLNASVAGRGLAEGLEIPRNAPLASYGPILMRCGVSQDSLSVVDRAIFALPEGATGQDLLIALSQADHPEVGQGVYVGTYHGAKGKEFDAVFLVESEEGYLPGGRGLAVEADQEEDRRLFYVGMTRARHRLVISWARERPRLYQGGIEQREVSRFVREAGLE